MILRRRFLQESHPMTQSTVQLEQVCKDYGNSELIHALRDANLSVAQRFGGF
jgi:hypothetical protein